MTTCPQRPEPERSGDSRGRRRGNLRGGGGAVLFLEEGVVVLRAVEGRVEIDEVHGLVGDGAGEDVEVVAVVEGAHCAGAWQMPGRMARAQATGARRPFPSARSRWGRAAKSAEVCQGGRCWSCPARRSGAKTLPLSGMGLTEVPEAQGQLTALQRLDLMGRPPHSQATLDARPGSSAARRKANS